MATHEDPGQQPVAPITTMVEHVAIPSTAGGLTKREHFAGLAMQGLLANPYYAQEAADGQHSGTLEDAALYHADELIARLAKGGAQ